MKVNLFKIECLTNMHVGSGDVNYNIVDNEVERDPVLGTPTIHSSGIKGALRSHFEGKDGYSEKKINEIFGSEQKKSRDAALSSPGAYKFLNANIIARPLRVSKGDISYANVTTVEIVNNIINLLLGLGVKRLYGKDLEEISCNVESKSFVSFTTSPTLSKIEGLPVKTITDENIKTLLDQLIGGNYVITTKDDLNSFDLPVMARNQLEKGSSKNLWYEEIVPHKSILFFVILTPDNSECELKFDGETVQFGGNASIGYGYTKVTKVV